MEPTRYKARLYATKTDDLDSWMLEGLVDKVDIQPQAILESISEVGPITPATAKLEITNVQSGNLMSETIELRHYMMDNATMSWIVQDDHGNYPVEKQESVKIVDVITVDSSSTVVYLVGAEADLTEPTSD